MCCCADAGSVRVFILDWRCFGISKVQHQLNEEITDKEIRLIGENGEQLGIVSGEEALRTAEEQGLDLVKISPQATPPVCKLMNYGKYKFEQSKREKEARKNQHVVGIKEIRMSPGIRETTQTALSGVCLTLLTSLPSLEVRRMHRPSLFSRIFYTIPACLSTAFSRNFMHIFCTDGETMAVPEVQRVQKMEVYLMDNTKNTKNTKNTNTENTENTNTKNAKNTKNCK